jgi:hypothetical protein
MPLSYQNLDPRTRALMVEEIRMDIAASNLYLSPWLTDQGKSDWSEMLLEAAERGSDATLAAQIPMQGRLARTAMRRKPNSTEMTSYTVPTTAPDTMAEGEFNRFYVRALCRRAIEDSATLTVYRAKAVSNPRPGSEAKIGTSPDPVALLNDLRTSTGVEPALGLPPGPNSGLTLRLP